jgi:uncharacterized membrane protein YeaQ/YmgE (transglycosylase-associated protein family)
VSAVSRSTREWIGVLTGSAAAGSWSIHDSFHGVARVALAAVAGACVALTFTTLIKLARQS